jgi:hypothetical protein
VVVGLRPTLKYRKAFHSTLFSRIFFIPPSIDVLHPAPATHSFQPSLGRLRHLLGVNGAIRDFQGSRTCCRRLSVLPFVFLGFYVIFGRFIVDARSRERTLYGVTSERIMIVSGLFSQQTNSLQLRTLTDLSLTERSDGSGTITFGPTHFMDSLIPVCSWPGRRRYAPPAFDLIERAKEVYEIICKAQRARPATS